MIPDIDTSYEILFKEKVPEHIIKHSERVTLISSVIGSALCEKGESLDLKLLISAGLLHDVKKFESLYTKENHAKAGERFLKSLGYFEVAKIVGAHIIFKPKKPYEKVYPEEVVFYADKRVKHEVIVSLEERFRDLKERYGKTSKSLARLEFLYRFTKRLEKKLFSKLPFSPEDLNKLNFVEGGRDVFKKCLESGSSCWRLLLREGSIP